MYTISNPLDSTVKGSVIELWELESIIEKMLDKGDWVNISLTKGDNSFVEVVTISKNCPTKT